MRKATFIRAAVVSLVLALIFPLLYVWAFGYGVEFDTPQDAVSFQAKSYEEQKTWLKEHSIQVSGFETLRKRVRDPSFWSNEYLEFALPVFILLFIACMLFNAWERKASSNRVRAGI